MLEIACNTSPIQYLHQLDRLELIHELFGSIVVPPAVKAELNAGRDQGVSLPRLDALDWIRLSSSVSIPPLLIQFQLGSGELEVLALAAQRPTILPVLDDGRARKCARALGLPVMGTIGLLMAAKWRGLIGQLKPELEGLRRLGFRFASSLGATLLREVGEL